MRFAFIAKHRGIWQIRQMCETLGVSRGGFYEWLSRPCSARSIRNKQILVQVRKSFELSDSTYE
jgi:putative transposase